jgi:hypothetical protein
MNKNKTHHLNTDYGIDSRYASNEERITEAKALMEARLERMKNLSKDQITKAKLLQLKLNMEDYLKKPSSDSHKYFTSFLKFYIDTIYAKRSTFAKDIDIASVSLSHIVNNHREPNQEFMMKLMIHSEKVYNSVSEFRSELWYQVYYQEKICDAMSNQDQWRSELEKHIHISEML